MVLVFSQEYEYNIMTKLILSLCDYSGEWPKPYKEDGYDVIQIDTQHGDDVRDFQYSATPVHGIMAAPPCDNFASSGARWWGSKLEDDPEYLHKSMAIVDACMRIILIHKPKWWVLENPVGRLSRYLGPVRTSFHPWYYGDPYTKKTCLWGDFNIPERNPVKPIEGSKIISYPPSKDRKMLRSITPPGFAKAFYNANP